MKKDLVVLFLFTIFIGFSVSTASAGVYLSGNLGASFLSDSDWDEDGGSGEFTFDDGGVATLALGTNIGSAGRIEIELASRVNDLDEVKFDDYGTFDLDGDVTTVSLMGNAYYDFKNGSRFTPFIGGGLGYANVEYDLDEIEGYEINEKDDDNVMAYQLMLGTGFAATERLSIDLQYRFFGTADPELDGTDVEYHTHNVI